MSCDEPPSQIVAGVAVGVVNDGGVFTTTVTVLATEEQVAVLATNEYVPADAATTGLTVGFCNVLVKPLGPVHEYVVPMSVVPVNCRVCPKQPGPALAVAVGVGCPTTMIVA